MRIDHTVNEPMPNIEQLRLVERDRLVCGRTEVRDEYAILTDDDTWLRVHGKDVVVDLEDMR